MTDQTAGPGVQVARAEMRPWTDLGEGHRPAGGPVLRRLVLDAAGPAPGRVLVVGPHEPELVRELAEAASETVLLVRSATDAAELAEQLTGVQVVAGALDGYVDQAPAAVDLVVAADGLERVMSFDSEPTTWQERLELLRRAAGSAARVLLTCPHDLAPTEVLDARTERDRHGDDDFDPRAVDPTRPSTHDLALAAVGQGSAQRSWLLLGPATAPRAALEAAAAAGSPALLAEQAVAAAAAERRPLLADPAELIRRVAAARPRDVASATLVVVGAAGQAHAGYLAAVGPVLVVADRTGAGWRVSSAQPATTWPDLGPAPSTERDTAQPSETLTALPVPAARPLPDSLAGREVPAGRAVPDTPPVSRELLRRAAVTDLPGFTELMHQVGRHVERMDVAQRAVLLLDDLYFAGPQLQEGVAGLQFAQPQPSSAVLTAALFRLQDELHAGHHRHPWPPWLAVEPLVRSWAEMAGLAVGDDDLELGRRLADDLGLVTRPHAQVPPLREALAQADESRRRLLEAEGHIAGLERTIGFRDKQLRTREDVIRGLRKRAGVATPTVPTSRVNGAVKLVRRTTQVRSVDELSAGLSRVARRARLARGR